MTQIGTVYGTALYELAADEHLDKPILDQLEVLSFCFHNQPEFFKLMSTPLLSKNERCAILDNSFKDKLEPYVLNFIKILTERGYMHYFADCYSAYRHIYNEANGILPVTAYTAVYLDDSQKEKLTDKLSKITGKSVELTNKIDPSCLGGVRLNYNGSQIDDTISHRLKSIGSKLDNIIL